MSSVAEYPSAFSENRSLIVCLETMKQQVTFGREFLPIEPLCVVDEKQFAPNYYH